MTRGVFAFALYARPPPQFNLKPASASTHGPSCVELCACNHELEGD